MPFRCVLVALFLAAWPLLGGEPPKVTIHYFEPIDPARDRSVPIKVYLPPVTTPQPVVIFSHGLGGSREGSPYLANHWAEAGYVCVFVQHPGSDEAVWASVGRSERLAALKQAANFQSALARYADITFIIDQLERWNIEENHPLNARLDLKKIGMCGHSFGANTTQALMGQRFAVERNFHDPRLKAFLAMSPSASKKIPSSEAFGHIKAPVLCMTGTEDTSPISPEMTAASRREVYAALPTGGKYELVLEGGRHSAFTERAMFGDARREHHHPAIQQISTRFWDAYLKGDQSAKAWLQSAAVKSDCHLVENDLWEWK